MGDAALVAPVVLGVVETYPNVRVTLVTRPKFAVFFENMPNVTVAAVDIDSVYKGLFGLYALSRFLTKNASYDTVIDLHDHLRTKILRFFLKINRFFNVLSPKKELKIIVFDKGRTEKKAFINHQNRQPLAHTTERYAAAFAKAGFPITLPQTPIFQFLPNKRIVPTKNPLKIGIAPFAKHSTKEWHFANFEPLIALLLAQNPSLEISLFGGGEAEIEKLTKLAALFPKNTRIVAGHYSLKEELALMQQLEVMLCMDSSNMHFAALAGVKTVSIWGATHPALGFSAYGENHKTVEIDPELLSCRPCSVFGDKPCARGDHACMTRIEVSDVAKRVIETLALPIP